MGQTPTAISLLEQYKQEQAELVGRESALRAELKSLAARVAELKVLVPALEREAGQRRGPGRPRKSAAAPAPKATTTRKKATRKATSGKKTAAKKTAAKKTTARKGRRKAKAATGVHKLGIVDAAINLAKKHGADRADAGQILAWFEEAGFKTRTGVPTRNSIYVSLNREFTEGKKKGRDRVRRVKRGVFEFPELAAAAAPAAASSES